MRAVIASLTDEQREAVTRRSEALLVSAAAGSGKTSVLVERFVQAVREDGTAPGRILAITFTERAAGELRARVRARLLDLGDREAARDTEAAFVGTFHGFCARLLRAHPLAAGLDPRFEVLDEGLSGRLRELAFKAALGMFVGEARPASVDLLAAYGVDRVQAMIDGVHRELRSRGQRLPRLPQPGPGDGSTDDQTHVDAVAACALLDELLAAYSVQYEQLKRARGALDFDDLELLARDLLTEHDGVRVAWSERFELLMVDEFQDTNPRQLAILRALDRGNLFTVGDEFQSIYGFRHADVSLFRARRAELEEQGGSVALRANFRSCGPLIDVVNAVFSERFAGYMPLVAARSDLPEPAAQMSIPELAAEAEVELLLTDTAGWEGHDELAAQIAAGLPHAQLWRQAEARLLAQRVAELVDSGQARAGEVVVLLRATGDLEVFERALQLRGLRTLAAVGAFWGHQQISDLVCYLRALANPLDEEALYGALASPLGVCSRDALALLAKAARERRASVWETACSFAAACSPAPAEAGPGAARPEEGPLGRLAADDRAALVSFVARLQSERATASRRTISQLIERSIDASGYRDHVLGLDWGERRLANVHKLLRQARRFEAREGRDLRGFLDHIDYLKQSARVEPDAPVEGVEPDAVRLMTVHTAKGLEFPVVCVADLGRQPNTGTPDLLVDGERVGLRLVGLTGARSTPALEYEELAQERRAREGEEEDRILYVAMTRARDRLLLSGAIDLDRWPSSRQAPTPISWLGPALDGQLPALAKATQAAVHELYPGGGGAARVRCLLNSPANAGAVLRMSAAPGAPASPAVPVSSTAPPARDSAPESGRAREARSGLSPHEQDRMSALSYTSLSELQRCGYRYYLERVIGLTEDRRGARRGADEGLEARARGTIVHRLLELFDFASTEPPSAEQVAGVAKELGLRTSGDEREEIAKLIGGALRAAPAARVAAARRLQRELPFAFSLSPQAPLITGVIDLLAEEPDGGSLVLDYKSDRVAGELDLAAHVERDYGIQRLLYALAVLRAGAPKVTILHWFLERPDEPVEASYAAGERATLQARLSSLVAEALGSGFPVSPRPHRGLCLTCPGRASLCSWGDSETLREDPGAEVSGADLPLQRL